MSDQTPPKKEPSLEMRLAAIEDKLSQLNITEDEMRAYTKVSSVLAGRGAHGTTAPASLNPSITSPISVFHCFPPPIVNHCYPPITIFHCYPPISPIFPPIIVTDCIQFRPTGLSGAGGAGSQFGSLGQQAREKEEEK
jgi:hypothetical protein